MKGNNRVIVIMALIAVLLIIVPNLRSMDASVRSNQTHVILDQEQVLTESLTRDLEVTGEICTWYGSKAAAVSLTFDDGLANHSYYAAPLLKNRGLAGTFNIYLDVVGCDYGMPWNEINQMAQDGNEISCHTLTHPDLATLSPEELYNETVNAKQYIIQNLTTRDCPTIAYPYGSYNSNVLNLVRQHFIGGRADDHNLTGPPVPLPSSPEDMYKLIPCNFGEVESLSHINGLVNDAVGMNGWLIEMIHAIEGGGYDPNPLSKFIPHLDYLANHRSTLWVTPMVNGIKYIKTRDNTQVNITELRDNAFTLSLNSTMDEQVYDHPLTVNVSVPSDWTHVRILGNGENYVLDTSINVSNRYFNLDMILTDSYEVEKETYTPSIHFVESQPGSGVCYWPLEGDSDTNFTFYMEYSSPFNRMPDGPPRFILDLNGDGDTQDSFDGMFEGTFQMEKTLIDFNYTDGCQYQFVTAFPPGTTPWFSFLARDIEGYNALDPDGITGFMPGPIINNVPESPSALRLESNHSLTPVFHWNASADQDLDDVTYNFVLSNPESHWKWEAVTDDLYLEFNDTLEFDESYNVSVQAEDDRGAVSDMVSLNFILRNGAPDAIQGFEFNNSNSLRPSFSFNCSLDADGDEVRYLFDLELVEGNISYLIMSGIEIMDMQHEFDADLDENGHYRLTIWSQDEYGAVSLPSAYEFNIDLYPVLVRGLSASDKIDDEGSLEISWFPALENDVDHYRLYRSSEYILTLNGLTPVAEMDHPNNGVYNIQYVDDTVEDGKVYFYAVVAVDNDGKANMDYFHVVNGTSIDDKAPAKIINLSASLHTTKANTTVIEWEYEADDDIMGFNIYRLRYEASYLDGAEPVRTVTFDENTTKWTDIDLIPGNTYYYAVSTFDKYGNEDLKHLIWANLTIPNKSTDPVGDDDTTGDDDSTGDDDTTGDDEGRSSKDTNKGVDKSIVYLLVILIVILFLIIILMWLRVRSKDDEEGASEEQFDKDEDREKAIHDFEEERDHDFGLGIEEGSIDDKDIAEEKKIDDADEADEIHEETSFNQGTEDEWWNDEGDDDTEEDTREHLDDKDDNFPEDWATPDVRRGNSRSKRRRQRLKEKARKRKSSSKNQKERPRRKGNKETKRIRNTKEKRSRSRSRNRYEGDKGFDSFEDDEDLDWL